MQRKGRVRITGWRACLWVGFVGLSQGLTWSQTPLIRPEPPSVQVHVPRTHVTVGGTQGIGACVENVDCYDDDACTVDTCLQGVCVNDPVPDCVPCASILICPPLEVVIDPDSPSSTPDESVLCSSVLDHCVIDDSCDDGDLCTFHDLCVDGICTGTPVPGDCTPCIDSPFCSDGNACTDDACVDSECVTTINFEDTTHCCDPVTGVLTPLDDDDPCTDDVCDPGSGQVVHSPVPTGTPCDDGDACTATDICDEAGGCSGIEFSSISCGTDAECFGGGCNADTGFCTCTDMPLLSLKPVSILEPERGCFSGDEELTVDIELGLSTTVVIGGQFLIAYDPTVLEFLDIVPGGEVDPSSPFVFRLPGKSVDTIRGRIFLAVGVNPFGGTGTSGPALMAVMRFRPLATCALSAPLCFLDENPQTTRLTGAGGQSVPFVPCCTEPLVFCQVDFETASDCCNPLTGELTPLDDGNICTDDLCDPSTGRVSHPPVQEITPCDDGDRCTVGDICNPQGGCSGTDLNTISCTSSADCFGGLCEARTNLCRCTPQLCIEPHTGGPFLEACLQGDQELLVNIELGLSFTPITGGQFLISYDSSRLEVVDILPGSAVDPDSPFSFELPGEAVDPVQGTIFYAIGVDPFGGVGTVGPAVMAAILFRTLTSCATVEPFCFLDQNPLTTRLADVNGQGIPHFPCCPEPLLIQGDPPSLQCPQSVNVDADAGSVTAVVTWDPVTQTGGCESDVPIVCTAANSRGADVAHLTDRGGTFPSGRSDFECTATDSCGASAQCRWSVEVSPFNLAEVSLELSPIMATTVLHRCIEFLLYPACGGPPLQVDTTLEFGGPFDLPGHAARVELKIPPGEYLCATARDPLHTLQSLSVAEIVDGQYVFRFEGDPALGGNWLVGGDLNDDGVVDLLDFLIFLDQQGQVIPADTLCGTASPHADLNGDGTVDGLDFAIIDANLGMQHQASCCPTGGAASAGAVIDELPLAELRQMGYGHLLRADLNGDGTLTYKELTTHLHRRPSRKTTRGRPSHRR